MKPCRKDIVRKRGDTKRMIFHISFEGADVPIGGWTDFKLGIDTKQSPEDNSTNVVTLLGALVTDGDDGRVYFPVPDTIPAGEYFYDAQAKDENGEVGTFVEGSIKIRQDCAK